MSSTGPGTRIDSRVAICLHDDEREFGALAEEWNRLAEVSDSHSVFLRHEWFDAAWQWLRGSCSLHIAGVSVGEELIALCPLVRRRAVANGIPHCSLEFMLVPDAEHCDVIGSPAALQYAAPALADYLASHSGWDRVRLEKLRPGSNVEKYLLDQIRARRPTRLSEAGSTAGIDLSGGWVEYYARRSRRLKKGNNHVANRIARSGRSVELRRITHADPDPVIRSTIEQVCQVSARSWKQSTGKTLDQVGPGAFIRRLTEHAVRRGWLSIWLLSMDGEPVATEYQLCHGGIVSALRADYDQAWEDLSPGTYLNWKVLQALFDERSASYYSMGPGQNEYKLRWAEAVGGLRRLDVYANTLRGRLLAVVDLRARPAIRTVRGWFRGPAEAGGRQRTSIDHDQVRKGEG